MIFASAIVDVIDAPPPHGGLGKFRVEVWGKEPHDYVRVYDMQARTDAEAARAGIDRFVQEISEMIGEDDEL